MMNKEAVLEEYIKTNSIRAISRKFGISRTFIRKMLKENGVTIKDSRSALLAMGHIKEKTKFTLASQEKAYLYGLVLGDLTPVRKSNYTLKLITHSTHITFMNLLKRDIPGKQVHFYPLSLLSLEHTDCTYLLVYFG